MLLMHPDPNCLGVITAGQGGYGLSKEELERSFGYSLAYTTPGLDNLIADVFYKVTVAGGYSFQLLMVTMVATLPASTIPSKTRPLGVATRIGCRGESIATHN